jgi:Asp-tRNA(Asn)/Glu-tRNA(Gln) amidotransferase A subunit family amidase
MARTFRDLALMQTAMTGPHPDQMTALRPRLEYPTAYPDIKGMRIAFSLDLGSARLDPDVRANTMAALSLLETQGAVVEEVQLSFEEKAVEDATLKALLSSAISAMLLSIEQAGHPEALTDYARYFVEMAAQGGGPAQLVASQEFAAAMHAEYDALFERGYDAFVCPTTTTSSVPADMDFTTDTLMVDGQQVDPLSGWILTPAFNLMYTVPVVNVPSGFDRDGVPTGIQIASRAYDDLGAFRVAAAYSAAALPVFGPGSLPPIGEGSD